MSLPVAPAAPERPAAGARRQRHPMLIFGGVGMALLLAAVFTLGSLNTPFSPVSPTAVLILFSVSVFVVIAFLVFSFVLLRSLVRLWADRRAGQMGSRFRTKMVFGAMGISLLPVVLLFVVSYALLNRTLSKWFPRPLEVATQESVRLLNDMGAAGAARRAQLVSELAPHYGSPQVPVRIGPGYDGIWRLDASGRITDFALRDTPPGAQPEAPHWLRTLPTGSEAWQSGRVTYLAARAPLPTGALLVGLRMPEDYLHRLDNILAQEQAYHVETRQLRTFRVQMLVSLLVITLLLLFSTTWVALFLEKQVTVPVAALAEATRQISEGNLQYRVTARAQDELGILVDSFNRMTGQLHDARERLEESNASLQRAFTEMEQRRRLMETILENIPTGVLSLGPAGTVERANSSFLRMLGNAPQGGPGSLESLLGAEAARAVERLMRRSLRMGAVSRELEIALPGRLLHAAVTVSSLGPARSNPGFVVVIDDLSELLHAQKASAWQEVAQRIAHEIKNPLTPIQLSAQRLGRFLERRALAPSSSPASARELETLVAECAGLIQREVATLGNLVDAFSRFARFPEAVLAPADLNGVVSTALHFFAGRLDGITVRTELAPGLPQLKADAELLRRVLVNLIDNAAEAMEGAAVRELTLTTSAGANGETVELVVADTGHGIAPQDKDRLFLPHFSTRQRGTGLGLAISERIIAEHHGTIRVEDNQPQGTRFVIRLPVGEPVAVSAAAAGTQGSTANGAGTRAAAATPAPPAGAKG